MRKLILVLTTFLVLTGATKAMAEKTPLEISQKILGRIVNQGFAQGFELINEYAPDFDRGIKLKRTLAELSAYESLWGDPLRYEIAESKAIGVSSKIIVGITYYKNTPIMHHFTYYHNNGKWKTINYWYSSPDTYFDQYYYDTNCLPQAETNTLIQKRINSYLELMTNNKINDALKNIFAEFPTEFLSSKTTNKIEKEFSQLIEHSTDTPQCYENIVNYYYGHNIYCSINLLHCKAAPIVVIFYYFKSKDRWLITEMKANSSLRAFFQ